MDSRDQPNLRPIAYAGPISFLISLLVTLFLLTAWFDEAQRVLGVWGRPTRTEAIGPAAAYQGLENAGGFGIVGGLMLAFLVWHPRRVLGLVPLASSVWLLTLLALLAGAANAFVAFLCGLTAGLTAWPCMMTALRRSGLTGPFPPRDRLWLILLIPVGLSGGLLCRWLLNQADEYTRRWILLGLGGVGVLLAWRCFWLNALELLLEVFLLPLFRFSFVGPGVHAIPAEGPVIVVANHTNMLDPLFIGKLVPRRLIPVMTAKYYDLPGLRFLMRHVVGTIRVPVASRRAEAPELAAMIDALDKGHCLVMFPEGKLRREGDPELSYFHQGVWRVLKARPSTPVVACWIEGGWGGYLSYKDGPPGKNKSFDWLRPIRIAVAEPEVLPSELLEAHPATRRHLTDKVAELRRLAADRPARQTLNESEAPTKTVAPALDS